LGKARSGVRDSAHGTGINLHHTVGESTHKILIYRLPGSGFGFRGVRKNPKRCKRLSPRDAFRMQPWCAEEGRPVVLCVWCFAGSFAGMPGPRVWWGYVGENAWIGSA
jgi:hypothetical protein